MRRVLFISLYYYPECGSSDYYLSDLKKYLAEKSFLVTTVAPNPVRDLDKETILKYKDVYHEKNDNMDVFRLFCGIKKDNKVHNKLIRALKFKRKLKKFIKKNHANFDVIYIPSNPPIFIPLMVEKLCKKYNITSVYSITDIWPHILGKYKFLNRLSKKAMLNANKVVTLSNDMKQSITNISGRKNIEVIRIWPDESIFDNTCCDVFDYSMFSQDSFNVFYVGNIGYFQNVEMLLDVAKRIKDDKKICFYIAGSGRKKESIINKINSEKILNVKFIGRVSNKVAASLYKIADLNIVSLNRNKIFYACPSKTSMCIYSKKPCLLLTDKSCYSKELTDSISNFYLDSSFDLDNVVNAIKKIVDAKTNHLDKITCDLYDKKTNLMKWEAVFGDDKK